MRIAGQTVDGRNFDDVVAHLKSAPNPFALDFAGGFKSPDIPNPEGFRRTTQDFNYSNGNSGPAWPVEQGQVGFSADQIIGTNSIGDCIGMIVRDPLTGKTALAHVDRYTSEASLQRIFDGLPTDRTLDVVLAGACHDPDVQSPSREKEWAKGNLAKVAHFLAGKDVNVVGAKIFDPAAPSAMTVDPRSFQIRGGRSFDSETGADLSFRENPDEKLSYAKMILNYSRGAPRDPNNPDHLGTIGLETAFDLTKAQTRNPVLLRSSDVKTLHDLCGSADIRDSDQVRAWCHENYNDSIRAYVADTAPVWATAYNDAYAEVNTALDSKIQSLRTNGTLVTPEQRDSIVRVLQARPLYAGTNAAAGNEKLRKFIQNDLFKPDANGTVAINIAELRDGNFADMPVRTPQAGKQPELVPAIPAPV